MTFDFLNIEYFFRKLYEFLGSTEPSALPTLLIDKIHAVLDFLKIPSTVLSLLLVVGIVYSHIRTHKIDHEEALKLGIGHKHEDEGEAEVEPIDRVNKKWQRVEEHINSTNSADWRLAILEADIMLNEMLEGMGYHAESLGEKLKSVEKSDFTNLDRAWEAHNIRNSIAHEGRDFLLSEREAHRVIALYEEVFREFHYI